MSKFKQFFHKLFHWEYWPFGVVYFPALFFWAYWAFKAKRIFFFLPSNPGIKNAGFLLESKKEIYNLIDKQHIPATILLSPSVSIGDIKEKMQQAGIQFPCIAKPDIGMKGLAVSLLKNDSDLGNYLSNIQLDFLIQEFISWPEEAGIFYYKIPGENQGKISGIVSKEFLTITGDGESTLATLLKKNPRHQFQMTALQKLYGQKLNLVLAKGELKTLVPYGNHARGAKFTDTSYWTDAALTTVINSVCNNIPGFYYGRLDIKYNTLEELKQGINFSIIELNGAGSEPTHIYDPSHSLFFAWKEINRHYKILYQISIANHKLGHPHMSVREGMKMLRENTKLVKKLQAF